MMVLCAAILTGQAQDKLKIGEIKDGTLALTNPEALKAFFMNRLQNDGQLGKDYQVSTAPEGNRCMIYFPVVGNSSKVSAVGVMLVKVKNDFCIVEEIPKTESSVPGFSGSVEIQCIGDNCNSCLPKIEWLEDWIPLVYCHCFQSGGGTCNMTSSTTVEIKL